MGDVVDGRGLVVEKFQLNVEEDSGRQTEVKKREASGISP